MKVYGIPNCNTVKKALDWFRENNIDVEFQDFKKLGVSKAKLKEWSEQVGWEALLNKRGTTWKKLDEATQATITNEDSAFALMQNKTSVIKRPVIETDNGILLGFDSESYRSHFS